MPNAANLDRNVFKIQETGQKIFISVLPPVPSFTIFQEQVRWHIKRIFNIWFGWSKFELTEFLNQLWY